MVADLVWENTAAGQITVFQHIVVGYPEGWLLAIAAGLGFVVALVLVASVNSTKRRRARRKQLRVSGMAWSTRWLRLSLTMPGCWMRSSALRSPPATSAGRPGRADPRGEGPESRADDHQGWVTPQPIRPPTEPLYQQVRSVHVREDGWEDRADHDQPWVTDAPVQYPPEPLYEQARRAAGLHQDWDLPVAAGQGRRR